MGSGLPLTLNNLEQGSTVDLTHSLLYERKSKKLPSDVIFEKAKMKTVIEDSIKGFVNDVIN